MAKVIMRVMGGKEGPECMSKQLLVAAKRPEMQPIYNSKGRVVGEVETGYDADVWQLVGFGETELAARRMAVLAGYAIN